MLDKRKIRAVIIAGFPGTGKSLFVKRYDGMYGRAKLYEFKYEDFKYTKDENGKRVKNPKAMSNYINAIWKLRNENCIIFTGVESLLLQLLEKNKLPYCVVRPQPFLKSEYLQRYRSAGYQESYIKYMDENWIEFTERVKRNTNLRDTVFLAKDMSIHPAIIEHQRKYIKFINTDGKANNRGKYGRYDICITESYINEYNDELMRRNK